MKVYKYKANGNDVIIVNKNLEKLKDNIYYSTKEYNSNCYQKYIAKMYLVINNIGIYLDPILYNTDAEFKDLTKDFNVNASNTSEYIDIIQSMMDNNQFIRDVLVLPLRELADENFYNKVVLYKENLLKARKVEKQEKIAKENEEQEKLDKADKKKEQDLIAELVSTIKNGGTWQSKTSPINDRNIFVLLAEQNNVKLPIKLQGWIIKQLTSMTFKEGKFTSYNAYTTSKTIVDYTYKVIDTIIENTASEKRLTQAERDKKYKEQIRKQQENFANALDGIFNNAS